MKIVNEEESARDTTIKLYLNEYKWERAGGLKSEPCFFFFLDRHRWTKDYKEYQNCEIELTVLCFRFCSTILFTGTCAGAHCWSGTFPKLCKCFFFLVPNLKKKMHIVKILANKYVCPYVERFIFEMFLDFYGYSFWCLWWLNDYDYNFTVGRWLCETSGRHGTLHCWM